MDATQPGCSAAVGVRGEVAWAGAGGLADLAGQVPNTTDTRFDIASIAKQFTATAALMLSRSGELSLSDPISDHIGGLPAWGRTVTIDDLIHHTSRIPDYWMKLDEAGIGFRDPASQQDTIDSIALIPRLEPGEGYFYSNSNYVLLAEIVHRVSGQPLPEFLAERIFGPLGLNMELTPNLQGPGVAVPYDEEHNVLLGGLRAYGAVGIFTNPSELVRWGDQYRPEGRLPGLGGEAIVTDDYAEHASDEGTGEFYGAGLDLEPDGDLNHDGRFGGFISTFTVSADRNTTIAVMCNGRAADRYGIAEALWEIWGSDSGATSE